MAMDRGYEDDETRRLVKYKGFEPVVPPKSSRLKPLEYDKERYKRRNEVDAFSGVSKALEGYAPVTTNLILCSSMS
jgi:hypothetical protein